MVGLDGAAWPTLAHEVSAGRLPTLGGLLDQGRYGPVTTEAGFSDASAWSSFATGLRVSRHGWANVQMLRPGTYELEEVGRDRVEAPPFWQHVSDQGGTVTVLDVPKSPRGRALRGVELADWLTHGTTGPPQSDPSEFEDEVVRRHGPGHGPDCEAFGLPVDGYRSFLELQADTTRRKGDLAVEQLRARPADLALVVFNAAHCVGHQCWHLHDPTHAECDDDLIAQLGDPVVPQYQLLDEQLNRLLAEVDDDTTVIVFGGLGMGANYYDQPFIDEILHRLDTGRRAGPTARYRLTTLWRQAVPHRVRTAMPDSWHRAARVSGERARAGRSFFGLDAGSTSGAVRVNLAGREPSGIVPHHEFDDTLDRLEHSFRQLRDADTGEPIVREVERVAEHHSGPAAEPFPDLFVHWQDRPVRAARSEEVGIVPRPQPNRSGHHTRVGFWVVSGPSIEPGEDQPPIAITDLGIAVAAHLGVHIDGTDATPVAALSDAMRSPGRGSH